jgi:hypothetical protein
VPYNSSEAKSEAYLRNLYWQQRVANLSSMCPLELNITYSEKSLLSGGVWTSYTISKLIIAVVSLPFRVLALPFRRFASINRRIIDYVIKL